MRSIRRTVGGATAALLVLGGGLGTLQVPAASAARPIPTSPGIARFAVTARTPRIQIRNQIPGAVLKGAAKYVRPLAPNFDLGLNFAFPIRDMAGLDALIEQEATTHQYLSRSELYSRFSPSVAQYRALENWLKRNGFRITHTSLDRMAISAHASTARVESLLRVKINEYLVGGRLIYSNANAPTVPASLGLQGISGLNDFNQFRTSVQMAQAAARAGAGPNRTHITPAPDPSGNPDDTDVRSGGYFPLDIRPLYDVSGHGFDGTGQTLGFTLWGAGVYQPALTSFASVTGDTLITADTPCNGTGTPSSPSPTCVTTQVQGDHLLTILENGNTNNQFGGGVETALDVEQAHGIATHAAMKYYTGDCAALPPTGSGNSNGSSCNGSDVGLEDSVEDAANDPTLHTVSDSWGYGGDTEFGATDPFFLAVQNSFAIAAAAGTTFYFSTGDLGTFESGFPADSQYVVSVGGTTLFSTSSTTVRSTENTWAAGGSWCSNLIQRPFWQTGVQNTSCPGRVIPDVSAVADTNSSVKFVSSTNASGGTQSGGVGGTSVAAPELNGLEAVTENFIAAQTYSGPTPAIGFEAPVMYTLGNSANYTSYFYDVECGDTANPSSGPDGDAAIPGWDPATGWGSMDWFNYSTGYAMQLGATNLSVPQSLANKYPWTCAHTPSNASVRGISCASTTICYGVGAAAGTGAWYSKFISSGSLTANAVIYKSTNGGTDWFSQNQDMTGVACTSTTTCYQVGDGGRIRETTDGGTTWTDLNSTYNKALTSIACPSASVCYAAGDRGTVLKTANAGTTWTQLSSGDGNPLYSMACPDVNTCYATDVYAHVDATTNGGSTWTLQSNPDTTPGLGVPGSGGPNPFAGLFGISCVSTSTCVAVGGFPPTAHTSIPIVMTNNGGASWNLDTSGVPAGTTSNYLDAIACLPATTTCFAVGRGGTILQTTDLVSWTPMTSNTTTLLTGISCLSTSLCYASGGSSASGGIVDVFNGSTWTVQTSAQTGLPVVLSGIACPSATTCFASGAQGNGIGTTDGGTTWTRQVGGSATSQLNGVSCISTTECLAVGNAGTVLRTLNGGQTWLPQTSGTTNNLNGVSCPTADTCVSVGVATASAAGTIIVTTNATNASGATFNSQVSNTGIGTPTNNLLSVSCLASTTTVCLAGDTNGRVDVNTDVTGAGVWGLATTGNTQALNAIECSSASSPTTANCITAGAAGVIFTTSTSGATWTAETSHTANTLSGVACMGSTCTAGGALGTVVTSFDSGNTWTQQGNPLSGPVTALNVGPTNLIAINTAGCSPVRCFMGTASSGDIMVMDPSAPTTTATVCIQGSSPCASAPDGPGGVFLHHVVVTLSSSGPNNGLASIDNVVTIWYSLDGGTTWHTYTGPIVLAEGTFNLEYYSDKDGYAQEQIKSYQANPIVIEGRLTVKLSLPAPFNASTSAAVTLNSAPVGSVSVAHPLVITTSAPTPLNLGITQTLLATTASPYTYFFVMWSPALPPTLSGDITETAVYSSMEAQLSQGYPAQFVGTNSVKQTNHTKLLSDWQTAERTIAQPAGAGTAKLSAVQTFACDTTAKQSAGQITSGFGNTLLGYAAQTYTALGGVPSGSCFPGP